MSTYVVNRTAVFQQQKRFLSSGLPSLVLRQHRIPALTRSARSLTTMAAETFKYIVLGGGNSSG